MCGKSNAWSVAQLTCLCRCHVYAWGDAREHKLLCKLNFSRRCQRSSLVQLLDLMPLDLKRASVGVQIRKFIVDEVELYIYELSKYSISQYISQYIQHCVEKQYYSPCHPDSQVKEEPQSHSHGCLMYWFDWRCIILLRSLITQCCRSRRWSRKQWELFTTRERKKIKYKICGSFQCSVYKVSIWCMASTEMWKR